MSETKDSIVEFQTLWLKESGIVVGSVVDIHFCPDVHDPALGVAVNSSMLRAKYPLRGTVELINNRSIRVNTSIGSWNWPYYTITKSVKKPIEVKLNESYTAVVTDVVQVGCQTLTLKHIEAIEKAIEDSRK